MMMSRAIDPGSTMTKCAIGHRPTLFATCAAAAAVAVLECGTVRKDLQLTPGVFLEQLRGNEDDLNYCLLSWFHPYSL